MNEELSFWYKLPYTTNPESSKNFGGYFTKVWNDTLLTTLQNFISVAFARYNYFKSLCKH